MLETTVEMQTGLEAVAPGSLDSPTRLPPPNGRCDHAQHPEEEQREEPLCSRTVELPLEAMHIRDPRRR